jgi:hypothetical protein
LKKQHKPSSEKGAQKFFKPSEAERAEFNREIFETLLEKGSASSENELLQQPPSLENWTDTILAAADCHLKKVSEDVRKDYIAKDTWSLIEKRNLKLKEGDQEKEVSKLSREIKKKAFSNRKNAKLEEFNENPADKHKKGLWKAVKNLKGKFTPRFIQMQNREGRLVSLKERAETIADYLEKDHWSNAAEKRKCQTNMPGPNMRAIKP